MTILLYVVVFIVILFLYLHVCYHLKVSNDLELFEIYDATTKNAFEDVCNLRQPSVFINLDNEFVNALVGQIRMEALLSKFGDFNIQIRDGDTEEYADVPLKVAHQLLSIPNKQWHTEHNFEFVKETSLLRTVDDRILQPPLSSTKEYDIMFGSEGTTTPLRYHINHRNFYVCTQGTLYVKMIPPKYSEYLNCVNDYDMFEFRAINTDNISPAVKALDIALSPGKILYIPPNWWHSFQYSNDTVVVAFKYCTYMNMFAHLPKYILCFLQRNNIRTRFTKQSTTIASRNSIQIDETDFIKKTAAQKKEEPIKEELNEELKEESKEELNEESKEPKEEPKEEKEERIQMMIAEIDE